MKYEQQLPLFHEWARKRGLSYTINFSSIGNSFEAEIVSASKVEKMKRTRCYDLDALRYEWEDKLEASKKGKR